jgi:hypothetical protein
LAIYGLGATFDYTDVSEEFVTQGAACIGWSEESAPSLYDMLRSIVNGDLIYIKTFRPQDGLTIKAVGIVTHRTIRKFPVLGRQRRGVTVRWVWQGTELLGKIEDKYPVRSITLFPEHAPEVQSKVIDLLLSALTPSSRRRR